MTKKQLKQLKRELIEERDFIQSNGNLSRTLQLKFRYQIELLDELIERHWSE